MPLIYMQHKQHGNHIVYTEEEAVANEKNGWVRAPFPVVKKVEVKEEVKEEVEASEVAEEVVEVKRKPGRPRKES